MHSPSTTQMLKHFVVLVINYLLPKMFPVVSRCLISLAVNFDCSHTFKRMHATGPVADVATILTVGCFIRVFFWLSRFVGAALQ